MSGFVDICRSEWHRLGVPDAVATEMAAELAADLAEAEGEGVSAEHFLGNAVFDARLFAASWAQARGVVPPANDVTPAREVHWIASVSAVVSAALALAGLGIVVRRTLSSPVFGVGLRLHSGPIFPGGNSFWTVGVVLLAVGLLGAAWTLWYWRRSASHRRVHFKKDIDLPSYR